MQEGAQRRVIWHAFLCLCFQIWMEKNNVEFYTWREKLELGELGAQK